MAFSGPQQYEAVHDLVPSAHDPFLDLAPADGLHLTLRHYSYLKIPEGCNHDCSFCIVPSLCGRVASRPLAGVLAEAESLVAAGTREILMI